MSRKNNLTKRKNQGDFDRRREEELKASQDKKRLKKQVAHARTAEQAQEAAAGDARMEDAAPQQAPHVAATARVAAGRVSKTKRKGFRIKKNVVREDARARRGRGRERRGGRRLQ